MACELYMRIDLTGVINKAPVKAKTGGVGREYMRFVVGVPNPRIANNKQEWTYVECTVWDSNLIRKIQSNFPNRKDVVNVEGEFFIQTFGGSSYAKMFVRDFRVVSIAETNETSDFVEQENSVQEFNENTNANDTISKDDYNNSF